MRWNLVIALCLLLCAQMAQADSPAGGLSYIQIGNTCGEGKDRPFYSQSEYAKALLQAKKAMKSANNSGQKAAAQRLKTNLEECKKGEAAKWVVRPIGDCENFLRDYKKWSAEVASQRKTGKFSFGRYKISHQLFQEAARQCAREIMSVCIDQNNTPEVDFVIKSFEAINELIKVAELGGMDKTDTTLVENNPRFLKVHFCGDTDYACKRSRAACDQRIKKIKAILDLWDLR